MRKGVILVITAFKKMLLQALLITAFKKMLLQALLITVFFIVVGFLILKTTSKEQKPSDGQFGFQNRTSPSPTVSKPTKDRHTFNWLIVRDKESVSLHSNLQEKLSSADAKSKKGCLHLISGGFYTKENEHTGLFIANGGKLTEFKQNSLFNGYFAIGIDGRARITKSPPSSARVALQSGPILMEEKKPVTLSLKNDKQSRRIVVAITRDDDIVFLVIYNKNSVFEGPLLAEVPDLLKNINENTNLDIVNALNLDGGSASAFISKSVNLGEITRIGSYFCVKEGLIIN